jgi:hypothetical protein
MCSDNGLHGHCPRIRLPSSQHQVPASKVRLVIFIVLRLRQLKIQCRCAQSILFPALGKI